MPRLASLPLRSPRLKSAGDANCSDGLAPCGLGTQDNVFRTTRPGRNAPTRLLTPSPRTGVCGSGR